MTSEEKMEPLAGEPALEPQADMGPGPNDPGPSTEILAAEIADLKDRLLRAVAETENVRRRGEREKEDTAKYAVTGFARELAGVADNLRRALDALPAGQQNGEALAAFVTGVEMTEKQLLAAFEKAGIKRIDPSGQKFDHNLHQAMFEIETADHAPGTVMQVLQHGYVIHDRLLRPAMVGVAKPPAAPASEQHVDVKA